MKFQKTITYAHPVETLLPVLTDPAFVLRKYESQGAGNIRLVSRERTPQRSRICVQRDVPVAIEIPAFARSLVPDRITLIQTDSWDTDRCSGQLEILFQGMPVKLTCQMKMANQGESTLQHLDFDIRVNVPMLSGKLEELLSRDLQMKFESDTRTTQRLISEFLSTVASA